MWWRGRDEVVSPIHIVQIPLSPLPVSATGHGEASHLAYESPWGIRALCVVTSAESAPDPGTPLLWPFPPPPASHGVAWLSPLAAHPAEFPTL